MVRPPVGRAVLDSGPLCLLRISGLELPASRLEGLQTMADLIKGLASPAVWVLLLMVSGLWWARRLRQRKRLRRGWYALLAATVLYVLLTSEIVAALLCYSLENRCRPASQAELAGLDAMVVLSGGALPPWRHRPRAEPRWATLARVDGAVEAFRRSGAQVLVTSGGKTAGTQISAAEAMRDFAVRLGVPAEKIRVQGVSLTTAEDATETARVLGPGAGRRGRRLRHRGSAYGRYHPEPAALRRNPGASQGV